MIPPLKELADTTNTPLVVAHRGASAHAPENTLAAIEQALHAGAMMVEVDVQLTADGHVVVFHDAILGRTTNGSGQIRNYPLGDVEKLDAGSWFANKYAGERIPTLRQAVEFLRGKAYINIEIKPPTPHDDNAIERARATVALVDSLGYAPWTLFASFSDDVIAEIHRLGSQFHTASIIRPGEKRLFSSIVADNACDAIVCSSAELTQRQADDIRKHSIFVGTYGLVTHADVHRALRRGARALVSDDPAIISSALAKLPPGIAQ